MKKDCFIKSSFEAPKRRNFPVRIKTMAEKLGLTIELTTISIHRDFLDRILFVNRELISFTVSGDEKILASMQSWLKKITGYKK